MNFCNPQSYDYPKPFIGKRVNYTLTCTHKDTPTYISLISSCWFTFQLCGLKSILLMSNSKYCPEHHSFSSFYFQSVLKTHHLQQAYLIQRNKRVRIERENEITVFYLKTYDVSVAAQDFLHNGFFSVLPVQCP